MKLFFSLVTTIGGKIILIVIPMGSIFSYAKLKGALEIMELLQIEMESFKNVKSNHGAYLEVQ